MPDLPPAKREPVVPPPRVGQDASASDTRYAELRVKTNFSFLEGASHPDELATRAAELGLHAIAVTDRNSLAGVVRAHAAAKQAGIKLLVGAELHLVDAPPVVVLATDRASYGRLARLLSIGRRRAPKGECELRLADLAEYAEGLLALVPLASCHEILLPPGEGGEHRSPDEGRAAALGSDSHQDVVRFPRLLAHRPHPNPGYPLGAPGEGVAALARYREIFGDRCYALAELHQGPDDRRLLDEFVRTAAAAGVPLAAANDVHFHAPFRRPLADALLAIRTGCTVAEAGPQLFANAERHLKSPAEMAALFAAAPTAIARTVEIADRCHFSLDELRYEYPEELSPPGMTPIERLTELAWKGAARRYPDGVPEKVRALIEHELSLIADLRYEAYFLTVWDLVLFARRRGILCQGRGSAANSAVCYCLGVTSVDPERLDVLFERFVSRERDEAPDIDVDFEHERREEVLQYIYEKYGRERAGMTAEVITYRPRSAVRDIGKALGLSLDRVDALASALDSYSRDDDWSRRLGEAGLSAESTIGRQLVWLVGELIGFPRHLSQHVGGMVITRGPLCELVPIENAAMPDRTVIEWDKDDLDELGILKVDCLALGMLTAIRRCFDFVEQHYGRRLTLANVPAEDPAVYEMICQADTIGVFQIESRAQMSMLPRLQPREFYDLVIEVAIVRPGPIQGKMVHPFLRRRAGLEPVEFPSEAIREVLAKTLGVPIFQEQAMRLAVVAAGFTPGEADQLRRAMGAWRREGVIEQFRKRLISGMLAHGLSIEYAESVFQQIRGFGEYGFPESHSASFALLVYVSSWLKRYYPAAFAAALLNSQPMGFYAPAQLVRDARQHGVPIRPAEVNASDWDCTLEEVFEGNSQGRICEDNHRRRRRYALRLGLRQIRGLPRAAAEQLIAARDDRPFTSLDDLARRARLGQAALIRLANADALGSLGCDRRGGLWRALGERKAAHEQPLFDTLTDEPNEIAEPLPERTEYEEVLADYRTNGLTLRSHPISFFREQLNAYKVLRSEQLATERVGRQVRVAGLVLVRQRPGTASGITFVTLEDETGVANLVVRPDVWERYRHTARGATAMIAHGRLERQGIVIHVLVNRLDDLRELTPQMESQSRDFR